MSSELEAMVEEESRAQWAKKQGVELNENNEDTSNEQNGVSVDEQSTPLVDFTESDNENE